MAKEEAHAVDESGELTLFKSSSDAKRREQLEEDEKRRAESQPKALSQPKGRFGQGSAKTRDGKANVSKEQLTNTGLSLTQYMNQWKKTGKRPTKSSAAAKPGSKPGAKPGAKKKQRLILGKGAKIRPFGGAIARALLGEDEKFGGDRGAIDFIRRRKPKGKKMGGEIKKYEHGGFAKQGANARLDESLGERRGKESTKSQSMKSRRNESRGARKPSRPQSAGAAKRGWGAAIR
jgi:hypothetical protein